MRKFTGLPGHSNESLRTLPCFIQDGSKRWYLLYNEVRSKNMFNSNDLVFHFPKSPPPKKKGGGFRSLENWITSWFSLQFQGVKNLLKPLHIEKPCGVSQPPASPPKECTVHLRFFGDLGKGISVEKSITTFRLCHNEVFYTPYKRWWAYYNPFKSKIIQKSLTIHDITLDWFCETWEIRHL